MLMPLSSWTLINVSANLISGAGVTSEATEKNVPEFLKWMQLFFPMTHFSCAFPSYCRAQTHNLKQSLAQVIDSSSTAPAARR